MVIKSDVQWNQALIKNSQNKHNTLNKYINNKNMGIETRSKYIANLNKYNDYIRKLK